MRTAVNCGGGHSCPSPRLFIRALCAVLAVLLLFSSCGEQAQSQRATFIDLFDTSSAIISDTADKTAFGDTANAIYDDLAEFSALYDIYNDSDSFISLKAVNEQAPFGPVKVDRRTIDLLLFSKEMYTLTGGVVNVAMGSVLSIWHEYREKGISDPENAELPDYDELAEAAKHTDINDVIIDEAACTVYFADPLLRLDVGAIAKGYAAGMAARDAQDNGVSGYLMSLGGNVVPIGKRDASDTPWSVGIQSPYDTSALWGKVSVSGLCVVTSGNYQRYYTVDGVNYCHIIDPETLMPASRYDSVTVLCSDSGLADALSTALFILPLEDGAALVKRCGAEALWIAGGKELSRTDGFVLQ